MDSLITASSFLGFLSYFGTGVAVLAGAVALVAQITPHREFHLIREGNTAAATALAGTLIGLALPLHSAIVHSVSLLDALIWGGVAAVIQLVAYGFTRMLAPMLSQQITDDKTSAGIFSAGVAISVGLINAAAMTP